jgi:hypothetical protein
MINMLMWFGIRTHQYPDALLTDFLAFSSSSWDTARPLSRELIHSQLALKLLWKARSI